MCAKMTSLTQKTRTAERCALCPSRALGYRKARRGDRCWSKVSFFARVYRLHILAAAVRSSSSGVTLSVKQATPADAKRHNFVATQQNVGSQPHFEPVHLHAACCLSTA